MKVQDFGGKAKRKEKKDSSNSCVVNGNCKKLETCMPFSMMPCQQRDNSFAFEKHHSLLFIYIGDFPLFSKNHPQDDAKMNSRRRTFSCRHPKSKDGAIEKRVYHH